MPIPEKDGGRGREGSLGQGPELGAQGKSGGGGASASVGASTSAASAKFRAGRTRQDRNVRLTRLHYYPTSKPRDVRKPTRTIFPTTARKSSGRLMGSGTREQGGRGNGNGARTGHQIGKRKTPCGTLYLGSSDPSILSSRSISPASIESSHR